MKRTNLPDWSSLIPVLPADGPRPRAIYLAIRRLIESGLMPPGTKLPTTRDLSARLSVSRLAAVTAFELLTAEGFAEARVGAGTFVAAAVPSLPDSGSAQSAREPPLEPARPFQLGIAQPDRRTMASFRQLLAQRLREPGPEHFQYGDLRGGLELRTAIAAYLRTARGVRCEASQILLTSGTQQALDLIFRAILAPGDAVWLEDPGYPSARTAVTNNGGRAIGVPVDAEGLDLTAARLPAERVRAVYVTPSHQFPLGVTMSMRRRLALLDWAARSGAWLLEDDYDSEFRYAGPPLTALQGMDGAGRVAYLGTFSKVLFPGLRVGYAVLPPELMERVLRLRAQTDRHPPTLTEGALAELLTDGHFAAHLRRTRRRCQAARDVLVRTLRRQLGLVLDPPGQGLHLVLPLAPLADDHAIAAAAAIRGVHVQPLSPLFIDAAPRQGLVLGFSGFAPAELETAGVALAGVIHATAPPLPGPSHD
ncbi:MAG TPA: PLP-dependent aminotransferase family protein [Geminicoccus sp.]|uniref:MocR-like pyridoxine biosynthesis transcription factor PdxR n=1 Tax=Geminicoccus sp. TaxID=2024832 RepID=UPI002BEB089F|nr:PLP-dependent aminotransferase family protein [Geminicoccus sp.]HWL66962.1 PLP-dependent aminotransferase family protein [Geminicoccus sp.]